MKDEYKTKKQLINELIELRQQIKESKISEDERKKVKEALKESEERYRSLMQTASDAIISFDSQGKIVFWNKAAEGIFGYSTDEVINKPFTIIVPKIFWKEDINWIRDAVSTGKVRSHGKIVEGTMVRKDGSEFPSETSRAIMKKMEGIFFTAVIRDITERKLAEIQIAKQSAILNGVNRIFRRAMTCRTEDELGKTCLAVCEELTGSKFGFIGELNSAGLFDNIVISNPGWDACKIPGSEARKSIKNMKIRGLHLSTLREGKSRIVNDFLSHPDQVGTPKGHPVITSFLGVPLKEAGEIIGMIGLGNKESGYDTIDQESVETLAVAIVEALRRKRAEDEIKKSRESLQDLTWHLQSIREEERTRIAREIHDDLGQTLTALKMDLSWLNLKLPQDQTVLVEKANSMSRLIYEMIQTIQRISSELRPSLLDNLGLVPAIEWRVKEFQKRTGLICNLIVDPMDITLEKDLSTTIFRILQETLTNVARHAYATRVEISLKKNDGMGVLEVGDNGKGITTEQISNPRSFGLIGIRERVRFWEGEVTFSGIRSKGTTVKVSIPLERGRKAH